jgi:hypothetical protein
MVLRYYPPRAAQLQVDCVGLCNVRDPVSQEHGTRHVRHYLYWCLGLTDQHGDRQVYGIQLATEWNLDSSAVHVRAGRSSNFEKERLAGSSSRGVLRWEMGWVEFAREWLGRGRLLRRAKRAWLRRVQKL